MGTRIVRGEDMEGAKLDTEERGLEVGLFDPNLGVGPYANSDPWDISSTLRKDAPETFVCSCCGKLIQTDPVYLHTLAKPRAVKGATACVACRKPFTPRRSDHVFCSKACKNAGWRLEQNEGGWKAGKLASDAHMRRCQAPDCEETLIGRRRSAKYCSDACRVRGAYHRGVSE